MGLNEIDFGAVLRTDFSIVQTKKIWIVRDKFCRVMANVCGLIQERFKVGFGTRCGWFHSLCIGNLVDCLS